MNSRLATRTSELIRERDSFSMELLSKLRTAHHELLDCIAELERVTNQPEADRACYTRARFRISQASLARRTLSNQIRGYLSGHVNSADAAALRALGELDRDVARQSTQHVSGWTSKAIEADWIGYREASRKMRNRMLEVISAEQHLIYRMLQRYRGGSPRAN